MIVFASGMVSSLSPRRHRLREWLRHTLPLAFASPRPSSCPCRCIPLLVPAAIPRAPFFESQIALQRFPYFTQRLGHPQTRRTQRAALTVVDDPTNRRTIIEHDLHPLRRGRRHRHRAFLTLVLACLRGRSLLQHFAFDAAQTTDFPTHLHFRVAVQLQHRLRQIPHKMVAAITMRHTWTHVRNRLDKRILLVGNPHPHSATQTLCPFFGLHDQGANLLGRARQQRLCEPDTLTSEFAHHIKRLVSFLWLQTINRKHDFAGRGVFFLHQCEVLLTRCQHALIPLQIILDRIFRQLYRVTVLDLGTHLRHRPMPRKTPMTPPTENVPTDQPAPKTQRQLLFRAERLTVVRACVVRAVDHWHDITNRSIQRINTSATMSLYVHGHTAQRTQPFLVL